MQGKRRSLSVLRCAPLLMTYLVCSSADVTHTIYFWRCNAYLESVGTAPHVPIVWQEPITEPISSILGHCLLPWKEDRCLSLLYAWPRSEIVLQIGLILVCFCAITPAYVESSRYVRYTKIYFTSDLTYFIWASSLRLATGLNVSNTTTYLIAFKRARQEWWVDEKTHFSH